MDSIPEPRRGKLGQGRRRTLLTSLCIILALLLNSCESLTPVQNALVGSGAGAIIGGLAGAALDKKHRGRGVAIGAAIGATVGGTAAYKIGKTRQRQMATRAQVERQVRKKTGQAIKVPVVELEQFTVNPQSVSPGNTIEVSGIYKAYGPAGGTPKGTLRLLKDNQPLTEAPLNLAQAGQSEFAKTITLPQEAASGKYDVQVVIHNGDSVAERSISFNMI